MGWTIQALILSKGRSFFLFKTSRLVLAPTYPPAQWISRALYQGVKAGFVSGGIAATWLTGIRGFRHSNQANAGIGLLLQDDC